MGLGGFMVVQAVAADARGLLSGLGFRPLSIILGDARFPPGSCLPCAGGWARAARSPAAFYPKARSLGTFWALFRAPTPPQSPPGHKSPGGLWVEPCSGVAAVPPAPAPAGPFWDVPSPWVLGTLSPCRAQPLLIAVLIASRGHSSGVLRLCLFSPRGCAGSRAGQEQFLVYSLILLGFSKPLARAGPIPGSPRGR